MKKNLFLTTTWEQILLIGGVILIMELTGLVRPVQQTIYHGLIEPSKNWWVQLTNQFIAKSSSVKKVFNYAVHIQDLELKLAAASASLTELETLKRENQELRFLLENTDRPQTRTILTRPVVSLAKPAVAGGKDLNLETGALVISRETLLGQLSKINEHESQVVLLHEKEATPILAKTESGVEGIIRGDGRKILFTEVNKTDQLRVGEKIYTLGQSQVEQGVLLGQISFINQDLASSVQTAIIEQYVSFFESSVVEIR
ncbi:MAG: rod shape-determining protein MreC [Patescibacteria group bacterium]